MTPDPTRTVKLSKGTQDILRNFSTINKSILIEKGRLVSTMSINKNIIGITQVRESFPVDMAIYDLPLFLGAISLFKTPMLYFPDDKKVIIYDEDTKGKTTFYYCDPEIISTRVPDTFEGNIPDKELYFTLPQADLRQLEQAAKVYGVEDLCIYGYAEEYSICVRDKKNETSNVFSLPLKDVKFEDSASVTPERKEFCYCFKMENLKLIEGTYHVCISRKNVANFSSLNNSDLNYFVALEP